MSGQPSYRSRGQVRPRLVSCAQTRVLPYRAAIDHGQQHTRLRERPTRGRERIAVTADPGSFEEMFTGLLAEDRLGFVDRVPYAKKLEDTRAKTGEEDAAITGTATINEFDDAPRYPVEDIRQELAVSSEVPIVSIDARARESAKSALVTVTEYALRKLHQPVAR